MLIGALSGPAHRNLTRDQSDDEVGEAASGEPSTGHRPHSTAVPRPCATADPRAAIDAAAGVVEHGSITFHVRRRSRRGTCRRS